MPFGADQAGAGKDRKVRGHGILRHIKLARYLARGKTIRLMAHEQAKRVQARRLRKRP